MTRFGIYPFVLALPALLTACASSIWSTPPRILSGEVIVFEDSALFRIPTGKSAHPWIWNDPASRRLSPAGGYIVYRTLQYGWWARVPSEDRVFDLGVRQYSDYYAA